MGGYFNKSPIHINIQRQGLAFNKIVIVYVIQYLLQKSHFNDMTICSFLVMFRRSRLKMELPYFINFIFIFFFNVLFFFTGICLNSLAILTLWKSVQLRKKLCYFMIMVLSCCDFLVILTNHPLTALIAMSWLTGKLDVNRNWAGIFFSFPSVFVGFSLLALLVMNFDRYLATYYPIFHRTSVTKGKLFTLLAILIVVDLIFYLMSINDFLISSGTFVAIFLIVLFPPMLFINYKIFIIARKSRRKQWNITRDKKVVFLEKYVQLLASSRLFCRTIHSNVCLHWAKTKLWTFTDIG